MGGLFRAPKPVVVAPTATADPTPVVASPSPEAAAQTARADNQLRARRGLAGTIATSARGVLEEKPPAATAPALAPGLAGARKTLLGE
ncbi:hypothetical protein BKE38_08785 [Pseudoroseomonas deserti]|uniref:Uncharacterized protein n=1 Tax=Teichococcus deserti TaxID=1817963 RepID=A0A1V2H4X9_9PROT|nr:hypothetical protein [Pseudoroseomonas deserti]ONG55752.1 hypothetical protein BKE38_08785 [Pseudoroseomonas deserti]